MSGGFFFNFALGVPTAMGVLPMHPTRGFGNTWTPAFILTSGPRQLSADVQISADCIKEKNYDMIQILMILSFQTNKKNCLKIGQLVQNLLRFKEHSP